MGLRPGSHSVFERKLYTQLEARLPTGCGWSQTYQQDDAEYNVDAAVGLRLYPRKSGFLDLFHSFTGSVNVHCAIPVLSVAGYFLFSVCQNTCIVRAGALVFMMNMF